MPHFKKSNYITHTFVGRTHFLSPKNLNYAIFSMSFSLLKGLDLFDRIRSLAIFVLNPVKSERGRNEKDKPKSRQLILDASNRGEYAKTSNSLPMIINKRRGIWRPPLISLLGLFIGFNCINISFAKDEKEKIPAGLKTKTETNYRYEKTADEYKKVITHKRILKYDERGNNIENALYDANDGLESKAIYKYNDKSKEIECANYGVNGKLIDMKTYKYDDKGNKVEWTWCLADGTLKAKWFYKYDSEDRLIEEVNSTRKFIYTFDNNGKLISESVYDANDKLQRQSIYKYDDKGKTLECTNSDGNNKLIAKFLFKYDNNGNEIECFSSYSDSTLTNKTIIKYDSKGNTTSRSIFSVAGRLRESHYYKYDDSGNQMEVTWYNASGNLMSKYIYKYDDNNNKIEWVRGSYKTIYKYDNKGNMIEIGDYSIKKALDEVKEIQTTQTIWEYEYYPEPKTKPNKK